MTEHIRLACPQLLAPHEGGYQLLGSRCHACGEIYFPARAACTRCCGTRFDTHGLGRSGVLWSWTIQGFLPKPPYNSGETEASFKPYGVGYVEMASGIKVESRLVVGDGGLQIGMPMQLTLERYRTDADGAPWFTFAFEAVAPAAGKQAAPALAKEHRHAQ